MGFLKIISYIAAAILIFIGVMFLWAGPGRDSSYIMIGIVSVLIGFGLIFLGFKMRPAPEPVAGAGTTLTIDLPGEVKIESMKCQKCGGTLSSENVQMVAGAPVVTCPFCGSIYQLTEEPKW